MAASISADNWFMLAQDTVPVATARGTRPGSSWADILFGLLLPRILLCRDEHLVQLGCKSRKASLPWDGVYNLDPCAVKDRQLEVQEIIWADDLAIPKIIDDPHAVEQALRAEATALTEAFFTFGFRLSFGDHKTAAIVTLCGRRSREAKHRLFGPAGLGGQLPILLEHLPVMSLPLPPKYKHLGVYQAPAGALRDEIRHRAAQARATFAEAKRKVYKSKAIALSRKAALLATTVLPKLLHGAGAWPPLTKRDFRTFSGAVWGFYRGVMGIPRDEDQHLTAHACFSLLQLPAPATLLRLSRLSYLGQLVRSGPPEVWAALRVDQPYAILLKDDLRWLYAWCWRTSALRSPDTHWEEWRVIMRDRPLVFKGLCKRAKLLTVHQHSTIAALDGLHRALRRICHPSQPDPAPVDAHRELCLPCRRSFPTRVSWAGHAARMHNYRSWAFMLPSDTVCRSCGKSFASIGRLRRHLTAAPKCLAEWGTFQPAGSMRRVPQHPLAPPTIVDGCQAVPPLFDFSGGINDGLLASLTELQEASESEVWAILEACIEPLETLRRTVETWRVSPPLTEWKSETAENMLLLLDPSISADTQQPSSAASQVVTDTMPQWEGLSGIPMTHTGVALDFTLPVPPPQVLDHQYPTSLSVRNASAYATWIEAACDTCVRCALAAATQPVRLNCPGLATSLGPAKEWLESCGFSFDSLGMTSAS